MIRGFFLEWSRSSKNMQNVQLGKSDGIWKLAHGNDGPSRVRIQELNTNLVD